MENRGINLDDHPEYRTYQTFYELGIAPPSHQDMADIIINTKEQANRAELILQFTSKVSTLDTHHNICDNPDKQGES